MTTVYSTTAGARYHRTPDCRALEAMQLLNEDMSGTPDAVCHAVLPTAIEQAAGTGKTPCARCKPPLAAASSFGHEPVTNPHFGPVCARCLTGVTHYDEAYRPSRWVKPTLWPCTSAVVLGLAPRP